MIRHTVTFRLKHNAGSAEELEFLNAARTLSVLPTVKKFECLKEIGKKNNFGFGLSMEFDNEADYESYNNHESHISFVQDYWIPQVVDFIEIDYEL